MKKSGLTCLEVFVIIFILTLIAAILLSNLTETRTAARRASCAGNLKHIALTLYMYSQEHDGIYPRVGYYFEPLVNCDDPEFESSGESQFLISNSIRMSDLYPKIVKDPTAFVCPSDVSNMIRDGKYSDNVSLEFDQVCAQEGRGVRIAGGSYTYLAHYFDRVGEEHPVLRLGTVAGFEDSAWKDSEVPLQLGLYANLIGSLRDSDPAELIRLMDGDLGLDESFIPIERLEQSDEELTTYRILRLRDGIMKFLITDINSPDTFMHSKSGIPVMFDNPGLEPVDFNHVPGGSNVLYLDGHVSFVRHEESFVTSSPFARVMDVLY